MSQDYTLQAGVLAKDKEDDEGDAMVVIAVSDELCDDEDAAFVTWDYNMNPVTVADKNEQYGYDPKQPFAVVAFIPYLDRTWPDWKHRDLAFLQAQVDDEELKPYKYPVNRLRVTGKQF